MNFIEEIKNRARKDIKTIVLPEATDLRTLTAVHKICEEGFAKVVLIGNEEEVKKIAEENNLDISKANIVDPKTSEKYDEYVESFYELRKAKGMTVEEAKKKKQMD